MGFFGKRLQIDIRRIHVGEEFAARFGRHVTGGHRDPGEAGGPAGRGGVDRISRKDHRVIVGERHRAAAELRRNGGFFSIGSTQNRKERP
jgi:hypothetical protein